MFPGIGTHWRSKHREKLPTVLSHPQVCGVPPVTPQAFTTQRHLPSAPGSVVALPTALGPSLPDVLAPPRLSPPAVPPVTPQPVTTRCPLLSAASQGKTAWGRCSGLCWVPPACLHRRASKGRGHLSVFECILVHLWKGQSKKPMTSYLYCHKPMYFPPVPHPHLLELWRGGLQSKE